MKIQTLNDITGDCAVCRSAVTLIDQIFHIGSCDAPHTRRTYRAALYHDRDLDKNFCCAQCAMKYRNQKAKKSTNAVDKPG